MKLERLLARYRKLLSIIEKHGKGEIDSQINTVKDIIDYIKVIDYEIVESENYMRAIKKMHENLFPPRGGLSDFFIWSNDYDERIQLNEPLDKVREEIWDMLRDS